MLPSHRVVVAVMCSTPFLLLALLAECATSSSIKESFYASETCAGSPSTSTTYTAGTCNLGGVVYSCVSSKSCLQIRLYGDNVSKLDDGSCTGTLISTSSFVCDECVGGGDTSVSTIVKGCSTHRPEIMTCLQSGWCEGSCQNDSGNLTVGCLLHKNGTAVDVQIVPCSAVLVVDYQDYNSCSGEILSQSVFPAGVCGGGMMWQC